MDIRALFLMQVVASTAVFTGAQFVLEACMDNNSTETSNTASLNCGNGNIYSVNVLARKSTCTKSKSECSGKTPSLLVDQLKCHWRSDCVINWPRDRIIMSENDAMCIGSLPISVWVSYTCIQPTDYHVEGSPSITAAQGSAPRMLLADICSDVINGSSMYESVGDVGLSGIIRSHKFYPWGYAAGQRNCSLKIYWPRNEKLVMTVQDIHLDEDDSLIVGNRNPMNVTSGTFDFSNEAITFFNFSVGNESKGGGGFALCFKFMPAEDETDTDVCKSLITAGAVKIAGTEAAATISAPPELPKRCLKKKTEKARKRCAAKMAGKKGNGRKDKNKKERKKKRKPKDNKRKNKKKARKQ